MSFTCVNLFNFCKSDLHFIVKKRNLKDEVNSPLVKGKNRIELNSGSIALELSSQPGLYSGF